MMWVTRSHLHLDRLAATWLIRRFVDREATFVFVGWDDEPLLPEGATPFGLPGVALGAHDENGTTFEKILRAHRLDDRALAEMALIVAAGVRWATRTEPPAEQRAAHTVLGRALDALGAGWGVFDGDQDIIERSLPFYDALHVFCQMSAASPQARRSAPRDPAERQAYWRARLVDPRHPVAAHGGGAAH
jgi:hypothetical protein